MAKLAGILPEKTLAATMIRAPVLFVCVSCALASSLALAFEPDRAAQLSARADAMGLASEPAWLALLHYKRETLLPRTLSQTDDTAFFLATEGKTDAHAELHADLQAMLQPSAPGHAQCLFPARWHWLKQQLSIIDADVACPRLAVWLAKMESDSVSLVFPAMYLNNPGSSFGHTFLRFNHPRSELLSHTLNYAAEANADDAFSYVYKGLFGGYRGVFRTRRYYETVQVYSNLENRDIWEYRLNLSADEVAQLKRHVWEVVDIDFDYFFLRENCAYRLLALLNAVRPEASLSGFAEFPMYAIPVDTVRALQRAQLIQSRHYRPSLASQIEQGLATMEPESAQAAVDLANSKIDIEQALAGLEHDSHNDNDRDRAALLDSAYQILQFRQQHNSPDAKALLSRRSQLLAVTRPESPTAEAPEMGHESARWSLSAGKVESARYYELAIKPAFHELLDAPRGYIAGAEINAFDVRLRWQPSDDAVALEQLRFFNVVSLSPWQDWYRPLSWQLDIKLYRQFIDAQSSDLVFNTRLGAGISQRALGSLWFGMLTLDAEATDDFDKGYSLLSGVQLGVSSAFKTGQFLLLAEHSAALAGFDFDRDRISAGLQINLGAQSAVRLDFNRTFYDSFEVSDLRASIHWYF